MKHQSHVHINTVCNGESIQLKTLNYLYIIMIENMQQYIVQYSSQVLSTISTCYTQTSSDLNQAIGSNLLRCLPASTVQSNVRIGMIQVSFPWLVLRNPHWQSPSLIVKISCTAIVTTDSSLHL